MRFLLGSIIVLSLVRPSFRAEAQSLRVEPKSEIALKRGAMDPAEAAWNETDRGLEKSILREDPAAVLKRIEAAASKRRQLDEARQGYHDALVRDAQGQLSTFQALAERATAILPREEIRRALDAQLDQLMSREASLKQALAEKDSNVDSARRRLIDEQVKAQLEQLAELRLNLHQQKQALASMQTADATMASAGKVLIDHTRGVVRALESNADQVREEAAAWQEYYSSLGQLVKNRQRVEPQPGVRDRDSAPASSTGQRKAMPE